MKTKDLGELHSAKKASSDKTRKSSYSHKEAGNSDHNEAQPEESPDYFDLSYDNDEEENSICSPCNLPSQPINKKLASKRSKTPNTKGSQEVLNLIDKKNSEAFEVKTPNKSFNETDQYLDYLDSQIFAGGEDDHNQEEQINYFDLLGEDDTVENQKLVLSDDCPEFPACDSNLQKRIDEIIVSFVDHRDTPELPTVFPNNEERQPTNAFVKMIMAHTNNLDGVKRSFSFYKRGTDAVNTKDLESDGTGQEHEITNNINERQDDRVKTQQQVFQNSSSDILDHQVVEKQVNDKTQNLNNIVNKNSTTDRNSIAMDLRNRIKRQNECRSTQKSNSTKKEDSNLASRALKVFKNFKETIFPLKRQTSMQKRSSRQIQSNKIIRKSHITVKSADIKQKKHFSDRNIKIQSIKIDFYKKQNKYLQKKSVSSKILQKAYSLEDRASLDIELSNADSSQKLEISEDETVYGQKQNMINGLLVAGNDMDFNETFILSTRNSIDCFKEVSNLGLTLFIQKVEYDNNTSNFVKQETTYNTTNTIATPLENNNKKIETAEYDLTAEQHLCAFYNIMLDKLRVDSTATHRVVSKPSCNINSDVDVAESVKPSFLMSEPCVNSLENIDSMIKMTQNSDVIYGIKNSDPCPEIFIKAPDQSFAPKLNFTKQKVVEPIEVEINETFDDKPHQTAKNTLESNFSPNKSGKKISIYSSTIRIRVDSLSEITHNNMQDLIKQSIDSSFFIKQVIDYKMNVINKMNAILENGNKLKNTEMYRKMEVEMKNMVDVDFIRFVHFLEPNRIPMIIKVQRLWRKAIDRNIIKKVVKATRDFAATSRLCYVKPIVPPEKDKYHCKNYYSKKIERQIMILNKMT